MQPISHGSSRSGAGTDSTHADGRRDGKRRLQTLLFAGLMMVGLGLGEATAQEVRNGVVALSYDTAGDRLLRVTADTLSVSDSGGAWHELALPEAGADAALVAAAVPAVAPQTLYIAGPGYGVQKRVAGGAWLALNAGLPHTRVTAFAVHRTQPKTLYVVLQDAGIHRSEDAGASWKKMDGGPRQGIRQLVHSDMPGSMQTGWLVAASGEAVRLSMDCFCGWRLGDAFGAGPVYAVAYDPSAPERLFAVAEGGVFSSSNGGRDWEAATRDGPVKVALVAGKGGVLYAATADGTLLRSTDDGSSWTPVDG